MATGTASSQPRSATGSQPPASSVAAPASIITFGAGGRVLGLDVRMVREVVDVTVVLPVPQTPPPVRGLCSLRGATVGVVDAALLLGLGAATTSQAAMILVHNHQVLCGLVIDRVHGVATFDRAMFSPAVPGQDADVVAGFLSDPSHGLITLLDQAALLRRLDHLRF